MDQPWEVDVVVVQPSLWQVRFSVLLKFRVELWIGLGSKDLDGHCDSVNLLVRQERWMSSRDEVYKLVLLRSKLEDGPLRLIS